MFIENTVPKLIMDLQLFAETGESAEITEPQGESEGFVYDENFFTGGTDDDTPEWLKDDEEIEGSEDVEEDEETEEVVEDIKQSDKANSAFAELRRQKKELEQQTKAYDKWAVDNFGDLGVTDFKTYQKMMDQQLMEQTQSELEEKGYDVESIHKAMMLNPKLKALMEEAEPQQEAPSTVNEDKLVADYMSLQEKYPDLVTKPEEIPVEVWDRYDRGYDLVEAFEIVNRDKLTEKVAKKTKEMARQETLNKLNSKKHLKTEKDGGSAASNVFIDKETMSIYKNMGFTEKQAIKFHSNYLK